jgi:hypothetical protein
VQRLFAATGGRCLSRSALIAAFRVLVRADPRGKWFRCAADADDWVATMATRVRLLLAHVVAAWKRQPSPQWIKALNLQVPVAASERVIAKSDGEDEPDDEALDADADEDDDADDGLDDDEPGKVDEEGQESEHEAPKAEGKDEEWFVGFDPELKAAYRTPAAPDRAGTTREYAVGFAKVSSKANPDAAADAVWSDGWSHPVAELTIADVRQMQTKKLAEHKPVEQQFGQQQPGEKQPVDKPPEPAGPPPVVVKGGAHYLGVDSSGREVAVRDRADRQPLISLYIGKHQRAQVPVAAFASVALARDFMRGLAELYVAGGVDYENIAQKRDELLREKGIALPTRGRGGIAKRPAAAPPQASAPGGAAASSNGPQAGTPPRQIKRRLSNSPGTGVLDFTTLPPGDAYDEPMSLTWIPATL